MINKRSLWFLTLFSLILVLSVYYITMPSELLLTTNNASTVSKETEEVTTDAEGESAELVSLRVEAEEEMLSELEQLKSILTDSNSNTEQKNEAFNKMQELNSNKAKEEELEKKIKEQFNLKSFVKIKDTDISVVVDSKEHDKKAANNIMRLVQAEFETSMNISVRFQK